MKKKRFTIKAASCGDTKPKKITASDLTDDQAQMLIDLSTFAEDVIDDCERDYGKELSSGAWGRIMTYAEDMVKHPELFKLTGNDLSSAKMHLEAVIYDEYEVDTGINGIYESTSIRSGSMEKRRFTVQASKSDDKFYTREFPDVKAGEVKVAPQRGNYTVFIGLSDGTIAYQWCSSKVKAQREAKYARDTIKKYGSDDAYWTAEGYKIYNPNATASVSTKRRFTVTTSSKRKAIRAGYTPKGRKVLWLFNADENQWVPWGTWSKDTVTEDEMYELSHRRFPNSEYDVDYNYTDYMLLPNDGSEPDDGRSVRASAAPKRRFTVTASKKAVKASAKSDTIVIFYNGNFVSSGGWDAVRGGIHYIVSRDDAALKACIDYCNSFGDPLIENDFASPRDVADTMADVIAAEYNDAWDSGEFFIDIPVSGTRGIEIFDKSDMSVNAATSVKCSEEEGFHLYGYDADGADVTTGYSDSEMGLEDEIGNLFADESVDTVDIYENGISGYGDYIGTITREEYDSDSTGRLLELLGTRDAAVESSTDIKCAVDPDDIKFFVKSYYGFNGDPFGGLADDITTDDWSEVESWSHEHLMKGESVKIDGPQGVLEITADEYNQAWEEGAADFDINEEIVDYKNRIVNSSTEIKCSDDEVERLWESFADVPMNPETEEIEEDFMEFPAGTKREDVWHWFDKNHSKGIAHLLYGKEDIKCAYRDDTVDKEAVRELVLVITNDGDLYRQHTTPMIENLKKKVAKGKYDRELAVKLWQYLADEGVRRYDKEFGSGRGSVSMLNPATRRAIAEELRDYYEEQIMWDFNHANDGNDDLTTL